MPAFTGIYFFKHYLFLHPMAFLSHLASHLSLWRQLPALFCKSLLQLICFAGLLMLQIESGMLLWP